MLQRAESSFPHRRPWGRTQRVLLFQGPLLGIAKARNSEIVCFYIEVVDWSVFLCPSKLRFAVSCYTCCFYVRWWKPFCPQGEESLWKWEKMKRYYFSGLKHDEHISGGGDWGEAGREWVKKRASGVHLCWPGDHKWNQKMRLFFCLSGSTSKCCLLFKAWP